MNKGFYSFPKNRTIPPATNEIYTKYGIDLSVGNFTISKPGIYEIANSTTHKLSFPNPDDFIGQRIVVINTDGYYNASIGNTNGFAPYIAGTTSVLGDIEVEGMWDFISIHSKWRGIKSGK